MKKGLLILVILISVVAGVIGGYFLSKRVAPHDVAKMEGMKDAEDTARASAEKKEGQLYTCPMHPFIITEEPGACPICGMTLVPVKGGDEAVGEEEAIKISPVVKQNMGIRTGEVGERELVRTIRTYGTFTYNERAISVVNTKIMGWIEKLYVNETGMFVGKGDPLLEIYSPALVSAQKEYLIALSHLEEVKDSPYRDVVVSAEKMIASARERLKLWDISEEEIEILEKTKEVRKTLVISSPVTGYVIEKKAFLGTHVMRGAELFKIADLRTLWLEGDVYEYELPWVRVGQEVKITPDYIPGRVFRGKITYIYPYLEGKTKTAKVRVEVENRDYLLKPDMYAHLEIQARTGRRGLVVPSEAVLRTGVRNIVFIEKGEGEFLAREVTLGVETGDGHVEIRSGLERGEKIVLSGQFMLDSESSIREAIRKMSSGGEGGSMEGMEHIGHGQ